MKTRNKLIFTAAAVVLAIGLSTYAFKASSQEGRLGFGPWFMHGMGHGPGMMGMGHGMMGARPNSATKTEMDAIHELIVNHDRISRTVTNLPDGIRTVTESDDPQIARIIKEHVASMGQRVSAGNDPGLPIESPALHAIFRNKDKIRTTIETTDKGVIVVQTSSDRETVAALQQHASEVTDLVRGGMSAVHTAMMRNGGMMHGGGMHEGMHGGMMRVRPQGGDAPSAR
jgi:hypothetical protein